MTAGGFFETIERALPVSPPASEPRARVAADAFLSRGVGRQFAGSLTVTLRRFPERQAGIRIGAAFQGVNASNHRNHSITAGHLHDSSSPLCGTSPRVVVKHQ